MPPEAIEGKGSPPGPSRRRLRVGRGPLRSLDQSATVHRTVEASNSYRGYSAEKFTSPRRIVRSIPAALEAICLKAMARNPDDRYGTAGELAAALRDFLDAATAFRILEVAGPDSSSGEPAAGIGLRTTSCTGRASGSYQSLPRRSYTSSDGEVLEPWRVRSFFPFTPDRYTSMTEVTRIPFGDRAGRSPGRRATACRWSTTKLRELAAQRLAQEKPGQTLQATALVHEAYLRLVGTDRDRPWDGRGHFFAAAAEAMRRILIDRARDRSGRSAAAARAADASTSRPVRDDAPPDDLIDLDEALTGWRPWTHAPPSWSSSDSSPGSRSTRPPGPGRRPAHRRPRLGLRQGLALRAALAGRAVLNNFFGRTYLGPIQPKEH